jgi:hypothetical protein
MSPPVPFVVPEKKKKGEKEMSKCKTEEVKMTRAWHRVVYVWYKEQQHVDG